MQIMVKNKIIKKAAAHAGLHKNTTSLIQTASSGRKISRFDMIREENVANGHGAIEDDPSVGK